MTSKVVIFLYNNDIKGGYIFCTTVALKVVTYLYDSDIEGGYISVLQ